MYTKQNQVSAIAKPWEVQHSIAKLVADEFFDQGDLEKLQLNTKPIAMMDRERKDELPKMQVGFIDVICMPLYKVLSETFPWISPLFEGTMENRKHWQDLAEKVEMGLTWIDHDTIEQPIEELAGNQQLVVLVVLLIAYFYARKLGFNTARYACIFLCKLFAANNGKKYFWH